MIKKEGNKFVLYSADGTKRLGVHGTERDAVKQERAIKAAEAARAKSGK